MFSLIRDAGVVFAILVGSVMGMLVLEATQGGASVLVGVVVWFIKLRHAVVLSARIGATGPNVRGT